MSVEEWKILTEWKSQGCCVSPARPGFDDVIKEFAWAGPFGVQEVYLPPQVVIQEQVEVLKESEKMVHEYMAYVSEEAQASKQACNAMQQTCVLCSRFLFLFKEPCMK